MSSTRRNEATTSHISASGKGKVRGPLAGIRVLDLGRVIAAPYATQMLADYGAEVIKLERVGSGDDARSMTAGCLLDKDDKKILTETSLLLLGNRSKRSVTLDLTKLEGQNIIRKLVAVSDVLVENFTPGVMKRFNLDYEALRLINPRLIYCSVSGWGQSGPRAHLPGFDPVLQAATGFMSVTGPRDGAPGAGPVRVGASVVDIAAGMNAAFAVMVALRHRDATGEGQAIDVSLYDTGIALQADNVQKFLLNGDLIGRNGSEAYGGAPARVFQVMDGELYIMAGVGSQFEGLCRVLNCSEITKDERFSTVASRFQNRDVLFGILQPLLLRWKMRDLAEALDKANVPCSPVNNYQQVFADPHTTARGIAVHAEHPLSDRLRLIASPMKLSKTPAQYERPPLLGEHTDAILEDLLQMNAAQIAALRDKGVI